MSSILTLPDVLSKNKSWDRCILSLSLSGFNQPRIRYLLFFKYLPAHTQQPTRSGSPRKQTPAPEKKAIKIGLRLSVFQIRKTVTRTIKGQRVSKAKRGQK